MNQIRGGLWLLNNVKNIGRKICNRSSWNPTDNSNFVVLGEANAGSPLGHLASDKPRGLEDD